MTRQPAEEKRITVAWPIPRLAPVRSSVRRGALVVGKCAGGASVATLQGVLMLVLAGLVHVPYKPLLLVILLAEMALTAFVMTAMGVLVASRIQQVESFQVVMQFLVLPMFFLSGAVFPLDRLPKWLTALTKIDPLTYAVDPMRRAVFAHTSLPAPVRQALSPGVSWNGWRLPTLAELAMVATLAALMLGVAVVQFSRVD